MSLLYLTCITICKMHRCIVSLLLQPKVDCITRKYSTFVSPVKDRTTTNTLHYIMNKILESMLYIIRLWIHCDPGHDKALIED